jgi:hypothetical protein
MEKLNVYTLKRPAVPVSERTFGEGEHTFAVQLRALDAIQEHGFEELARENVARWLIGIPTGEKDDHGQPIREVVPFPAVQTESGEFDTVELNEQAIRIATRLELMQPDRVYDAQELLIIAATMSKEFNELVTFAAEVETGGGGLKKGSAASMPESSESALNPAPGTTLSISSEPTNCSDCA